MRPLSLLALVLLLALPASGGAVLVLQDGREVEGSAVDRREGNYYLDLPGGEVLTIPAELVAEVRLQEAREPQDDPRPLPGLQATTPRTLVGPADGPRLPRTGEQLSVFGRTAGFQRNLIDPVWRPTSDWTLDPSQNNFAPSRWSRGPVDYRWRPTSAFDRDFTEFSPSRWYRGPIDSTWWPSDGFAKPRSSE